MKLIMRLCFGALFVLYFTAAVLNVRRMMESPDGLTDSLNIAVIICGMVFLIWRFGVEFRRITRITKP